MTTQDLKDSIDLASYIRAQGIELKKHGRDLIGVCPFHQDSNPSLIVTPNKHLWHCMGCGKGGSVIDFVVARESCSVADAIQQLSSEYEGMNVQKCIPSWVGPYGLAPISRQLSESVMDTGFRSSSDCLKRPISWNSWC